MLPHPRPAAYGKGGRNLLAPQSCSSPDDQGMALMARLVPLAHAVCRVVIPQRLRRAVHVLLGVHGASRGTADHIVFGGEWVRKGESGFG